MKNKFLPIMLVAVLVLAVAVASAQILPPPPPPPGGGPGGGPGNPAVPIDGGVFLLIASGLAYGAKKLYNK